MSTLEKGSFTLDERIGAVLEKPQREVRQGAASVGRQDVFRAARCDEGPMDEGGEPLRAVRTIRRRIPGQEGK